MQGKNVLKVARRIIIGLFIGCTIVLTTGFVVFKYYYGLLDSSLVQEKWEPVMQVEEIEDEIEGEVDESIEKVTPQQLEVLEQELKDNLIIMRESSSLKAEVFNILLVGVDSRDNAFSGRSDSMILLSINQKNKTFTITSFLRDIYVSIPDHGSNRLNAAYAYGGVPLLEETITQNFGISVDKCMVVNFNLVMEFVDQIDGLDVNLLEEEIQAVNKNIKMQNESLGLPAGQGMIGEDKVGIQHLDGNQALAYARVRYVGTDFARTKRQRDIILLSLEKVKSMNLIEMNNLLTSFLPKVKTDLTEGDCAKLLLMMMEIGEYSSDTMTIPMDGSWSNRNVRKMAVLKVDFVKNSETWLQKVNREE